jgi:hypothetical protein
MCHKIQTMDDHVGAVGKLMFINEGEKLLSCSADRTVVIVHGLDQLQLGVSFLEELHHPITPRTSYQPGITSAPLEN